MEMKQETKLADFDEGVREPFPEQCPKCNGETYIERKGKHIKWSCVNCGYLKFIAQKPECFIMPFGKHKGKTIKEIRYTDTEYFYWCLSNLDNKIRNKFIQFEATNDL